MRYIYYASVTTQLHIQYNLFLISNNDYWHKSYVVLSYNMRHRNLNYPHFCLVDPKQLNLAIQIASTYYNDIDYIMR